MSKGLEALERAKMEHSIIKQGFPEQEYIKTLDDIENELKALEIIKTVCPNIFWVVRSRTYKEYKRKCKDDTLLENDYHLLREVLL